MDKGDIDRFLAHLTPAQETNVLLREISVKLSALIDIATMSIPGDLGSLENVIRKSLNKPQGKKR